MPSFDVKSLHFAWFVGHVLTLLGGALHIASLLCFYPSNKPYYLAYMGAIGSYGIVVYQSHGIPSPSGVYVHQLALDENAHYLGLAIFWLLFASQAVSATVIPFATYSAFHVISYTRSHLLEKNKDLQAKMKTWTDVYYGGAMRFVAIIEVVAIPARLFLSVLWPFRVTPFLVFCFFLRFRYLSSTYTRQAFADVNAKLDSVLPPAAKPTYAGLQSMLSRLVNTAVQ
ncbi:hypothetical protein BDB00DRAFT_874111 [Zychaea mexicana]|uniref:uncharacterized protein n=1 Tax=Zychaea mexicana TaxID=64656 RepID=UPI0022FEDDA2|nr:uncharacterized protein BDB00DRAFT_874111 [Zychaea mexicana]KAI9491732.1 hypothetical protein BDB00DRAFT_874111 [Zychaea mexicana]